MLGSVADVLARPVQACPLCGANSRRAFVAADRNRRTPGRFEYRQCKDCRTYFLAHPPEDMTLHYPEGYHEPPPDAWTEFEEKVELPKLEIVKRFVPKGHLIDVGASYGGFVQLARRDGFEVTAIEMDPKSSEHLRELGIRTVCSDSPDALTGLGPASVITFWHSLEHFDHPWQTLEIAAAELERGGAMVISTPNPDSPQFRLLKSHWFHTDAPRHLFLIPLAALRAHLKALGLQLAYSTTNDPVGRGLTYLGWISTIRPVLKREWLSLQITERLAEARWQGATYTGVFVKE